jgi:hypothetical protein
MLYAIAFSLRTREQKHRPGRRRLRTKENLVSRLGKNIVCGLFVLGAVIASVLLAGSANAQVFNKVVDGSTPNTIAGGLFSPDVINSRPAVDGNNVIFRNLNSAKPELYSFNGASFKRLVTTNSLLPGLSANSLSTVGQAPALAKNGVILFPAAGHACIANLLLDCGGLWTQGLSGGPFSAVANLHTPDPSDLLETLFFGFAGDLLGTEYSYDLDDTLGEVAFHAFNSILGLIGTTDGIYVAGTDGSALTRIVDTTTLVHPGTGAQIGNFLDPVISNGTTAFVGLANGFQGLYAFPATALGALTDGSPAVSEILTSLDENLLDDPNPTGFINFVTPSLALAGRTLAFVATNAVSSPTYGGIFTVDIDTGVVTTVVSTVDSLTGLGSLLPDFSLSMNKDGQIVFRATDGTNVGYYLYTVAQGVLKTPVVLSGKAIQVASQTVTPLASDLSELGNGQLSLLNFVFQLPSQANMILLSDLTTVVSPPPTPTPTATPTPGSTPTPGGTPTPAPTATPTPAPKATPTPIPGQVSGRLEVTSWWLYFGRVRTGHVSHPMSITLTNPTHGNNATPIAIGTLVIPQFEHNFTIQVDKCSNTVLPAFGGSCFFSVTFSPDTVGFHRSHLQVSNNTDHDSMSFILQGHGK